MILILAIFGDRRVRLFMLWKWVSEHLYLYVGWDICISFYFNINIVNENLYVVCKIHSFIDCMIVVIFIILIPRRLGFSVIQWFGERKDDHVAFKNIVEYDFHGLSVGVFEWIVYFGVTMQKYWWVIRWFWNLWDLEESSNFEYVSS